MAELLLIDITDADTEEEAVEAFLAALDSKIGKFNADHDQSTHGNWARGGSDEDDEGKAPVKRREKSEDDDDNKEAKITDESAETVNRWAYSYTGTSAYTKMRKDTNGKMTKVFKSMPSFSGTAYRGLGLKQSELDKLKKGSSFRMAMHSSASKDRSVASPFALFSAELDGRIPVMLEVETSKGAADVSKVIKGDYKYQKEVVLMKGGRFKVASVEPYRFKSYKDKGVKISAQDGYRVKLIEV